MFMALKLDFSPISQGFSRLSRALFTLGIPDIPKDCSNFASLVSVINLISLLNFHIPTTK